MKILKLILGIISCVLCPVIIFQSCAAGFVNIVEKNGSSSGTVGFLVALLLLAAGIVMIASRNSKGKGGNIACIVMLVIAAIIGFCGAGIYSDLYVWSSFAIIIVIVNIIDLFTKKPAKEKTAK